MRANSPHVRVLAGGNRSAFVTPHPFIEMLQARVTNMLKRGIDLGQIRRMAFYTGFNGDEISTVTMADAPPGNKRKFRCSNSVEDGIIVKLNAAIEESAGLA